MRVVIAAAALCAVTGSVTACGDSGESATPVTRSSAAPVTDQPPIPLPGVADLNLGLTLALDPNSPRAQALDVVQGSNADPELVTKMAQAGVSNGVKMTVTSVRYAGNGLMEATATLSLNGKPVEGEAVIPFVAENGRWKLQLAWACQMLTNTGATSPACT
ncbi:hypothetical protein [Nocardia sp. NPDC057668]|uniref:hypothetical protein n=1 Tax=Nocardia sp. NPDC057668 TaxID=3346202 RepID=UPI00366FDCD9